MCRYDPVTKTERRCPSYLDRASYNAKRRARYQPKKTSLIANNTPKNNTGLDLTTAINITQHSLINAFDEKTKITNNLFKNYTEGIGSNNGDGVFFKVDTENVEYVEDLNVSMQDCSGSLIDVDYFSPKVFSGTIDHTKLDENSYKLFFNEVELDSDDKYSLRPGELVDREFSYTNLSKQETQNLTPEELKAVRFYTGDDYEWFTPFIHDEDGTNIRNFHKNDHDPYLTYAGEGFQGDDIYEKTQDACDKLDSAISKGPGIQRKVYRGMKYYNDFFLHTTMSDWLNDLKLGNEVVFDGYHSTSQSSKIGYNYTGNNGIVFEMLTPEGIQISSSSQWQEEFETLMPRKSRYQVVGIHKNESGNPSVVQMVAINSKGEILDGTNSDPIEPLDFRRFKK